MQAFIIEILEREHELASAPLAQPGAHVPAPAEELEHDELQGDSPIVIEMS